MAPKGRLRRLHSWNYSIEDHSSVVHSAQGLFSVYQTLLNEHPLVVKSLTGGIFSGIGDTFAQIRDPTRSGFNFKRMARFSVKGIGSGFLWTFWYDGLDLFCQSYVPEGKVARTTASIALEQFVWSPVIFSLWDIPFATLANGAKLESVPVEIRSKLEGMLVANAKIWTVANVAVYNAPLELRILLSSFVDIFWQSIVADIAATCGADDLEECVVEELGAGSFDDFGLSLEKEGGSVSSNSPPASIMATGVLAVAVLVLLASINAANDGLDSSLLSEGYIKRNFDNSDGEISKLQDLEDARLIMCAGSGSSWEQCFWYGTSSSSSPGMLSEIQSPNQDHVPPILKTSEDGGFQRTQRKTMPPVW